MKVLSFSMRGRCAHFCTPYTNVYRLTQPCPTKTAILGFVGAVLGRERDDLSLYEQLKCGVEVCFDYRTKSLPYTARKDFPGRPKNAEHSLISVEMIVNPRYRVYLTGADDILFELYELMQNGNTHYTPYLGLAQCVAFTDFDVSEPIEGKKSENTDVEVSGAFIRSFHGELDFEKLSGEQYRLTEFSGLKKVSKERQFEHATFTVNLCNFPVPLKQIRNIISIAEKNVAIF